MDSRDFGLGINFDLKGLMTVVKQLFIFLRLSSDKGGARCAFIACAEHVCLGNLEELRCLMV